MIKSFLCKFAAPFFSTFWLSYYYYFILYIWFKLVFTPQCTFSTMFPWVFEIWFCQEDSKPKLSLSSDLIFLLSMYLSETQFCKSILMFIYLSIGYQGASRSSFNFYFLSNKTIITFSGDFFFFMDFKNSMKNIFETTLL